MIANRFVDVASLSSVVSEKHSYKQVQHEQAHKQSAANDVESVVWHSNEHSSQVLE
jgi:hypothetical protein